MFASDQATCKTHVKPTSLAFVCDLNGYIGREIMNAIGNVMSEMTPRAQLFESCWQKANRFGPRLAADITTGHCRSGRRSRDPTPESARYFTLKDSPCVRDASGFFKWCVTLPHSCSRDQDAKLLPKHFFDSYRRKKKKKKIFRQTAKLARFNSKRE